MTGLALETATAHVEVAVLSPDGVLAHLAEDVGHGHTRRLAALATAALAQAGVAPRALAWVAADLGPGSFTGVRVGIATARAFALAAGAQRLGVSSLAALAHAAPLRRALVVPLVEAGRLDVYAGFYRVDARGAVKRVAAPRVLRGDALRPAVDEVAELLPGHAVRFVGPGAGRERERLEAGWPTSTAAGFRFGGLSALDLAAAARTAGGPGAGLPADPAALTPVYVRPAQAEERVRRAVAGAIPTVVRDMTLDDVPAIAEAETRIFPDPWTPAFFASLVGRGPSWARVAERDGALVGYAVTVMRPPHADLENVAVLPGQRRNGVARALVEDALAACRERGATRLTLEVRVSNDAAQALYRDMGFGIAGLRKGYYRMPAEDALLMARTV